MCVLTVMGMKAQQNHTFTITAHAGAYNTEDNTMPSIEKALAMNDEILEFDVRCRPNGSLAMSHDEIKSDNDGVDIADVLKKIQPYKTKVNLDIKETRALPDLYRIIKSLGMEKQVLMTGIELKDVEAVKRDAPGIIFFLNCEPTKAQMRNKAGREQLLNDLRTSGAEGVNINFKFCTHRLVTFLHENGFQVSVWTLNDEKTMKKYSKLNPDNITTRHPDMLRQVMGE